MVVLAASQFDCLINRWIAGSRCEVGLVVAEIACTDVWRAANMMMELYGDAATINAAMRADALLDQGDTEGFFIWKRIARAIDHLSQVARADHESIH